MHRPRIRPLTAAALSLVAFILAAPPLRAANPVFNSSFEQATNPGVPDGFWSCIYTPDRHQRLARITLADWGQCATNAFDGAKCIVTTSQIWWRTFNKFPILSNHTYTASVHVRADTPGASIQFGPFNRTARIEVGTAWQRVQHTWRATASGETDLGGLANELATVWWDALQFEEGDVPTPYAPSATADAAETVRRDGKPAGTPTYRTTRAETPPLLDGVLDDPCWSALPPVVFRGPTGGDAARTEARIAYDDTAVYFALTCFEPEMKKILVTRTGRDDMAYADDSIELFLDTQNAQYADAIPRIGSNRVIYDHFMVNALGAQGDYRKQYFGGMRADWRPPWQAATTRTADRWSVEIAIPLSTLWAPGDFPERWGIGICRNRAHAQEFIPWHGAYHRPESWPQVAGFAPRLLVLRSATPATYRLAAAPGAIEVACTLRNDGRQAGTIRPVLIPLAPAAAPIPAAAPAAISAGSSASFRFDVPFRPDSAALRFRIEVPGDKPGAPRFVSSEETLDLTRLIDGPGPDRELYIRERDLLCRFDLSRVAGPSALQLDLRLSDLHGQLFWSDTAPVTTPAFATRAPLRKLPHGEYRLEAALRRGATPVVRRTFAFRRLPPPEAGSVVTADRHSGMMLFDGQPFPVLGASSDGRYSPTECAGELDELRARGLTTLYLWDAGRGFRNEGQPLTMLPNLGRWLDAADAHGFKVHVQLWPYVSADLSDRKLDNPELLAHLSALVTRYRTHPALLTWELWDEPNTDRALLQRIEVAHRLVRELDPYHPVTVNVNSSLTRFPFWRSVADIPSADPYPVPQNHASGVYVEAAAMRAIEPFRPLRFWLQSYGGCEGKTREPTPAELQAMAYMVLVAGGSQFLYFTYKPMSPDLFGMWDTVNREVVALTPALAATEHGTLAPDGASGVRAQWRRERDGALTLIAVNIEDDTQTARFALPGAPAARAADVLFEGRKLPVADGILSDAFRPLERHVYHVGP